MKISPKLCRLVLALFFCACVVTFGTASARAQKNSEGKTISPPPVPPSAQPTPPPIPAKPVADKLAPAGWTRYAVGEPALFSLILPAEPGASVERMNITPGVAVTVRTYLSSTDSGVYGATYVEDLPAASLTETMKRSFFEGFVKGFAEGFQEGMKTNGVDGQLTMLEQRTATASGLAGYEQDFSFDRLTGRVRLVFDGGRAYAVMAFWNALSTNSERSIFFESLRVTKRL